MGDTTASIQRIIEVGGSALPHDMDSQLESAVVIDRLTMPDMFTLVFRDPERDILGKAHLEIGAKVKVSTTSTSETAPQPLIDGEVTSVETECGSHGTLAVVRGYDMSLPARGGSQERGVPQHQALRHCDQDRERGGPDARRGRDRWHFDHVFQANQSDLDFLYGLARQVGYDCRVDGQKLLFKKPVSRRPARRRATIEHRRHAARVRQRAARLPRPDERRAQVSKVEVRGWDPRRRRRSSAPPPPARAMPSCR